ncbi:MAG: SulP family inorganic anion transporter [Rhodobacterales bacterium]|nr:SulP family inorganic anion transporter [Rhodobacterales bacterium]MDX5390108.1 SulP family inorganic anion transporter [Rhodobacterales bacterium]MDX5489799.1 SulP family inorganic anion transporter [Rhodobacterales bacterium]
MLRPQLLTSLSTYSKATLGADFFAGITVAMVALPLSLAIAIASGATPAQGLITAIVAGFLISALGGSTVQIGGPTGAFIVVVAGVIAQHGYDGLVLATAMAGVILLVAGWLRAGSLIAHVPEAVVNGFTIGIAVLIAASQIKDLLGLSLANEPAELLHKIPALWSARDTFSIAAFGVGIATMMLIVLFRRAAPRLPGLIVALALTSGTAVLLSLPVETIEARFGALPRSLPLPAMPDLSLDRMIEVLPSALVIAFLAGIESLLSAVVADRMTGGRHKPNAEVVAQGAANLASAAFGGLPATGAIARTATNVRAGGQTPVAGMIHAVAILAMMILAAGPTGQLAMPAMAGLLILTAWNMAEPHKWGAWMRERPSDRVLLLLTMALTVLVDLTVAIGVGVALGLALKLRAGRTKPETFDPRRL